MTDMTELHFDQGWTLVVTRHGHGVSLDWHRSGSWDAHLTDILPHEVRNLVDVLKEAMEDD